MKKYILLIDDDPDEEFIVGNALKEVCQGMRLMYAKSAYQALKLLDFFRPAVILVDMHMPLCDGRETIEMLRREDSVKDKPIVLYSTLIDKKTFSLDVNGVNYYLKKTNNITELINGIRTVLINCQLL